MSRAGTPTDNGYAERFVGMFKLAVAERYPYHSLGAFLRAAEAWVIFTISNVPMRAWAIFLLSNLLNSSLWRRSFPLPLWSVYIIRYLTPNINKTPLCKHGRLRTRALLLWRSKRDSLMIGSAQERWKAKCELSQSVEPGGESRLSPSAFTSCIEQVYSCSGPVSRGLALSLLYKERCQARQHSSLNCLE